MKFGESKETFETGAQRDTTNEKCRPDLCSPFARERIGWVMQQGAKHYGDRNWERGMPFTRVMQSIHRHLMAYEQGKTDEDHLAQLAWNVEALLHFEEMIKSGRLPASLNDLPYQKKTTFQINEELDQKYNDVPPMMQVPEDF